MEEPSSLEDVEKLLDEMLGADGSSLGVYQGCLPTLERVEMKLGLLVDRKFQVIGTLNALSRLYLKASLFFWKCLMLHSPYDVALHTLTKG